MFCDAHCHPLDLLDYLGTEELESRLSGTAVAASSSDREQFEYNRGLAQKFQARAPFVLCFALHPQFPAYALRPEFLSDEDMRGRDFVGEAMALLEELAAQKSLGAIGETGFDLYDEGYRQTEKVQEEIYIHHTGIAAKYGLPVVIHNRKAMHKIFAHEKILKKLPAVIFHSWQGTPGEGDALLRHGVNAFFSFGASIINNHKRAQACCAHFPLDRLLFETDSPFIPIQGSTFSSWTDLPRIYKTAAVLRSKPELLEPFYSGAGPSDDSSAGSSTESVLENIIAANFTRAFQTR